MYGRRSDPLLLKRGVKMKKMQKSTAVALCGVIAALCIVLMLLSGLIQIASIAIPALCGILLIVIVLELSAKWALCVYAAVSVISLLLVADKEAAVMFAAFFGYYPILKAKLDPIRPKAVSFLIKLLIFNTAMILEYFAAIRLLGVPAEEYELFGVSLPLVLLVLANAVFVIYDYALFGLVVIYCSRVRPKLKFLR